MKYHSSVCFGPKPRVLVHSRIVQPLLDITLLFLGLPLVIAMDNRNVFRAIGLCILLVVLFLGVPMLCQYFCTDLPIISPSLAAWTPLMIFVPAAVGMSSWMWER
jgi:lipopolysaccharide export system permease protein